MKKLLALFLAAMLLLSLAACGGKSGAGAPSDTKADDNAADASQTQDTEIQEDGPVVTVDGQPRLNVRHFGDTLQTIELTTENWQEYLEWEPHSYVIEQKNNFGDVVSSETVRNDRLVAKTDQYYQILGTEEKPAAIEFTNRNTGETRSFSLEYYGAYASSLFHGSTPPAFYAFYGLTPPADVNYDDYACTRIQGTLYIVDIPEETLYGEGDDVFFDKLVDIVDADGNHRYTLLVCTPPHAIFYPDFDELLGELR